MNATIEREAGAGLAAATGSALPDPSQMTPEYLVQLTLEKYACACSPACSKELHEWAMRLKTELLNRVSPGYSEICRLINDAPVTQTGGLLVNAVKACKRAHFFASDDDLVAFVTNVVKETKAQNDKLTDGSAITKDV